MTNAILTAQIKSAVNDYFKYVPDYLNDVTAKATDKFFDRLANDAWSAKAELRDMMRKSPCWNEELQAWVINGNRTHEPNLQLISEMAWDILQPQNFSEKMYYDVVNCTNYFSAPIGADWLDECANAVMKLAPKANLRQKKSKVFGALCKALGVWQDSGEFQMKYSALCNEFNAKKIDFKLIVSINPAHFLTMSNSHEDSRKAMMVSCHSLDASGCYRNGAIGYARDSVTMIAFTVKDFNDKESLNNRKTSRQLFMYKPNNGVLLQSRLYDSNRNCDYGGVDGEEGSETCQLYAAGRLPTRLGKLKCLVEIDRRGANDAVYYNWYNPDCQLPATKVASLGSETPICLDTANLLSVNQ